MNINQYIEEALISANKSITKLSVKNLDELKKIIKEKYNKNHQFIELNSYDISNLTNLSYAFSGLKDLEEIDIECWDVSKVTTMEAMFFDCESLKTINLLSWDVKSLTSTNSMFFNCKSLKDLNLSTWKCYDLKNLDYMFYKCSKLENLELPEDILNVDKIQTDYMFKGCFTLSRNKKLPEWYK